MRKGKLWKCQTLRPDRDECTYTHAVSAYFIINHMFDRFWIGLIEHYILNYTIYSQLININMHAPFACCYDSDRSPGRLELGGSTPDWGEQTWPTWHTWICLRWVVFPDINHHFGMMFYVFSRWLKQIQAYYIIQETDERGIRILKQQPLKPITKLAWCNLPGVSIL